MYDAKSGRELSVRELNLDDEGYPFAGDAEQDNGSVETWNEIRSTIDRSELKRTKYLLEKFLDTTLNRTIDEDPDRQARRNSAVDMLDVLDEIPKGGSSVRSAKTYLEARLRFDEEKDIGEQPEAVEAGLRDNWEYLRAGVLYRNKNYQDALKALVDHTRRFPTSEKNQAVMYMISKIRIELGYAYDHPACGIQGNDYDSRPFEAEVQEECQDENWHQALRDLKDLIKKYPNGRYQNDAKGWLAYVYRRGGKRDLALAEYYRLLGHPTDRNARLEAKKSLQLLGHEYDDQTLDRVEALISDDVNASMAYAYHRIYNYATDLTYETVDRWYSADDWSQYEQEKKRVAETKAKGSHELKRIVSFSSAMMKRFPNAKVSGGFVLRIAEAQLELENYQDSINSVRTALTLGVSGELRAQALWVGSSAEHALKQYSRAAKMLKTLIAEYPSSKHVEGARRLIALTAEDTGDLESALEQYLILGYRYDVAYYADVLMPIDRLEKFAEKRSNDNERNYLKYAVGIRYMRESRWEDARRLFLGIATANLPLRQDYYADDHQYFVKEPNWENPNETRIDTTWVMQDLKTIDHFEYMEELVAESRDDESKAEALYQLASAYYQANSLTFYNPALWKGARSDLLFELDSGNNLRLPNESRMIFEHFQAHETFARSLPIFLQIVDRYPNTKVAKDALFSAVVAHDRLSSMNNYWRASYSTGMYAGPRLVTNADINGRFPKFRWPLSRIKWEPATRTVNGGNAYPEPPKAAPKLSVTQRIERKVKIYATKANTYIGDLAKTIQSGLQVYLLSTIFALALYTYGKYRRLT
ncbi:MAG: tetratricopeptide repeat protein [Pyrinomonadaceae bacterium]